MAIWLMGNSGGFFRKADGFDRYGAADDRIGGLVDHTHATAAQFAGDFVARDLRCRNHGAARGDPHNICKTHKSADGTDEQQAYWDDNR